MSCSSRVPQLRLYAGSGKSATRSLGQRSPTNTSSESSTTETESGLCPWVESAPPSTPQLARKPRLCSRGRTRAAASPTGVKSRRPHLRYAPPASRACHVCLQQTRRCRERRTYFLHIFANWANAGRTSTLASMFYVRGTGHGCGAWFARPFARTICARRESGKKLIPLDKCSGDGVCSSPLAKGISKEGILGGAEELVPHRASHRASRGT